MNHDPLRWRRSCPPPPQSDAAPPDGGPQTWPQPVSALFHPAIIQESDENWERSLFSELRERKRNPELGERKRNPEEGDRSNHLSFSAVASCHQPLMIFVTLNTSGKIYLSVCALPNSVQKTFSPTCNDRLDAVAAQLLHGRRFIIECPLITFSSRCGATQVDYLLSLLFRWTFLFNSGDADTACD